MPSSLKLRGWRTKAVLRSALADVVPPAILTRRKMGFPVPLGTWLRGEFSSVVDDLVLGPRARARGLFDEAVLRRLVAEHRAGAGQHGDRLWLLMNLEIWQRVFLDGDEPAKVAA
jgi:asparagine synthase (glutamine-hydrolysing)